MQVMNLVKTIDQYENKYIYFCDPIKNNIMTEGNFIRILYSTPSVLLNGIYLFVTINDFTCEKYYNKYRCLFNVNTHKEQVSKLKEIEENILEKINIRSKIPQMKIYEQMKNGNVKVFNEISNKSSNSFILKISGVWETQFNYGLTYKFIKTIE
jgi:uncharacterized CHY-type Zn-finger protein